MAESLWALLQADPEAGQPFDYVPDEGCLVCVTPEPEIGAYDWRGIWVCTRCGARGYEDIDLRLAC